MYLFVYGGKKDDKEKNVYEAKVTGSKVPGFLMTFGCFTEGFLGWIRPVLGFVSENIQKAIDLLISLPAFSGWRGRALNDLGFGFTKDFYRFIFHWFLSLFGNKKSKQVLEEIKQNKFLTKEYVKEKCAENIGITSEEIKEGKKSITNQLFREVINIFNKKKTHEERAQSSRSVATLISPFTGSYSFFALIISTPIRSALSYFEKSSKIINALYQSGIGFQHIMYIFRLAIAEQFENKAVKCDPNNLKLNKLKSDRNKLFLTGLGACLSNIISIPLQFINLEERGRVVKTIKDLCDLVKEKGLPFYLSWRRYLKGIKDKLDNPEFYNDDGTPKIISDKLEELETIGKKVPEPSVNGAVHKITPSPTATDPK